MTERGLRKTLTGTVISNKMQKTVVVQVERLVPHPKYKKYVRRRAKFKAHDEQQCQLGDRVLLRESRPLSREKRWTVLTVLARDT